MCSWVVGGRGRGYLLVFVLSECQVRIPGDNINLLTFS